MLSTLLSSLSPVFIISKTTGIFIFNIDEKTQKLVDKSWHKLVIAAVSMLHFLASFMYFNFDIFNHIFHTKTSKLGSPFLIFMDHNFYLCCILWLYWNRRKILKILEILGGVDQLLLECGIKVNYEKFRKRLILSLAALTFAMIQSTIFATYFQWQISISYNFWIPVINFGVFTVGLSIILQIIVFMLLIGTRFLKLNLLIQNHLLEMPKLHLKLSEAVALYNSIYGFPLMLIIGNILIWTCMSASLIVLMPNMDSKLLFGYGTSLMFSVVSMWSIFTAAGRIKVAQKEAVQLLYEKIATGSDTEGIFEFIMQIRHTNPGFSCKFFDFDWHLVFKFAAASVMYLIIIVQLEGSMEN